MMFCVGSLHTNNADNSWVSLIDIPNFIMLSIIWKGVFSKRSNILAQQLCVRLHEIIKLLYIDKL